ncbi:TPA: uracil/xanthine transporter [Escherichia coli]|nr:uracil/xanthine transporter [Escherichia coli]
MSFDLIIKNGTVILENEARVVDIAVKGGKIAAIGQDLGDAKEVMDASGLVVSPGMVDAHTHISEPGRSHWEGYETGTRAAAKGGITTMIEMPLNQLPATVDRASIELKFDAAKGKLTIDAAQLGGLVSYNIDRLHELDEVGVVGFKCFVATCGDRGIDNDFRDVNDWQFFKGAQKLGELGQPVLVHCENALICDALACFAQAFCGHRRAIMEGPGGLWWGTILTITLGEASRGTPINDIATSLAVGIALSGVLTMLIGFSGLGHRLARLFTPSVMVLFMLMLGAQLTTIFFKGMLGLPFGIADPNFKIQLPPFALSVAVMCLVLAMIIFLPQRFARYGLLVGTITGWLLWYFCFPSSHSLSGELHWQWFPLGSGGALSPGIILTAVITGLVNISNTYGAIRGTDVFYPQQGAGNTRYRRSFVATGFMTLITVPLAVIPFSPFVSSIGLLTQTGDYTRRSFIYGSVICLLVALVPALTRLFCSIPLPVSSAVMLVSYLPLLFSALVFSQQITFTARNIYRLALPLFVGIFLMALPPVYLQDLPLTLRPLLSNGLLVGILLAVLMDNLIPWERIE